MEEEGRNLPTPPLVRTTRDACAEICSSVDKTFDRKMRRIVKRGFGLSLREKSCFGARRRSTGVLER